MLDAQLSPFISSPHPCFIPYRFPKLHHRYEPIWEGSETSNVHFKGGIDDVGLDEV